MDKKISLNQREIHLNPNENIIEKLLELGVSFTLPCGGKGICKKCRVKITYEDGREEEALLCQIEDLSNIIEINLPEDNFKLTEEVEPEFSFEIDDPFGIEKKSAVDLGTTSITIANIAGREVVEKIRITNPQVIYGRDVISRCNDALIVKLREITLNTLKNNCKGDLIAISGNTVMQGIIRDESIERLKKYPFDLGKRDFTTIRKIDRRILVLPEIGGFLGGDAVSLALLSTLFEGVTIAVDIGTNTEIILRSKDEIVATSVPAGSALEGGRIRYGTGPIEGAICKVKPDLKVETIGNKSPIGFCGSGIISAISILKEIGFIDEKGTLLVGDKILLGGIPIYQDDVREVQLAKSAIYSAIKLLLKILKLRKVEKIIIAGNLGYHIDKDDLFNIRIFPDELKESEIVYVGNSSLWGAKWALLSTEAQRKMKEIVQRTKRIELTTEKDFMNYYLEGMNL